MERPASPAIPVVGRAFDLLVDLGGTAIFEEIVEMIGLRDLMIARAASPEAARNWRKPTTRR